MHACVANGLRKCGPGLSHEHTMIVSDCDRVDKWCCDVSQRNTVNYILGWGCDIIAGCGTATSSQTHAYMFFKLPSQNTSANVRSPSRLDAHYTQNEHSRALHVSTHVARNLPTCKHYNLPSSTCTCCTPGAGFPFFSALLPDRNGGGPQHGNAQ